MRIHQPMIFFIFRFLIVQFPNPIRKWRMIYCKASSLDWRATFLQEVNTIERLNSRLFTKKQLHPPDPIPGFFGEFLETIPWKVTSTVGGGEVDACCLQDGPSSLARLTIPQSVTAIGVAAFRNCSSLASITIPQSVTAIHCAFCGCSSLESIIIPESVTAIGDCAFQSCSSLASITIPESVTVIGLGAFQGCSSLESITIPESVTAIGDGASQSCSSLASITLPESLREDGQCAFDGKLQDIVRHVWLCLFVATVATLIFKFESASMPSQQTKFYHNHLELAGQRKAQNITQIQKWKTWPAKRVCWPLCLRLGCWVWPKRLIVDTGIGIFNHGCCPRHWNPWCA